MPKKLPEEFRQYFWDVRFEDLDATESSTFIVGRVLDRGTTKDIKWIINNYGVEKIKEILLRDKGIDVMTGKLWSRILDVDPNLIPCLQKPYSPIHFGLYS